MVGGGRYVLKQMLGQGGMGVVWLVYDKRLRESAALKFLPTQIAADAAAFDDLRRETLRSRKLSHPNIIRIHDLYEAPGELAFISMEYVDGPDLHFLRANRPTKVLPWNFLRPLVRQLCAALDYAHGEKVIHRDLKPANLMLDSNERLKLADFGLACVVHDSLSRLSGQPTAVGTLQYMSPQQADGKKPQITDDIYSIGATLYELLTSQPPFYTGDISYQVRNTRPQPMNERLLDLELKNEIPSEVSALVMACLAKEPEQRPQSVKTITTWLDATEKPQPPSAIGSAPIEAPSSTVPPKSTTRGPSQPAAAAEAVEKVTPPSTVRAGGAASGRPLRQALLPLLLALGVLGTSALAAGLWYWAKHRAAPVSRSATALLAANADRAEFEILFNGRDLNGWKGDAQYWSVQDGTIVGHVRRGNSGANQQFLIWAGSEFGDFELRLSFRLETASNDTRGPLGNYGVYYWTRNSRGGFPGGAEYEIKAGEVGSVYVY